MFESSIATGRLCRLVPGLLSFVALVACSQDPAPTPDPGPPTYVGSAVCADCHETQFTAWQDSHHALAMLDATPDTVIGDFDDASISHFGTESSFTTRGENFYVTTDNATGDIQEYPIKYVFGIEPLQQYLIEFPGGRLQTLPLAWDARTTEEGGQRWFHMYPDEAIPAGDPLHWTGQEQNWNYMCAECHSTNLLKGYEPASDAYTTTWSEINVGCEGCHGPASRHAEMATSGELNGRGGLVVDLDDAGRAVWQMNPDTGIAARSEVRLRPPVQPEACGRCHSRRSLLTEDYVYGQTLMDTHLPSLLDERLYHADGQIYGEVYVWGSFLQSRMYQAGVSCTDCHDPHAARVRTGGEPSNICATCHLPATFDSADHHRHPDDSVACVDCHMASRDFMVVDGRRDHSFRIPRPDLALATGAPNACNDCHTDQDAAWADRAVTDWFGEERPDHYGLAIHAGRTGGGNPPLLDAIANNDFPGIARGTALSLLRPPYSQEVARAIQASLQSSDPLIRLGALRALPGLQPELQVDWAGPLLADRVRAIRIEAAAVISPMRQTLHIRFESDFRRAEQERLTSIAAIAERPEAQIILANLHTERGNPELGEAALRQALSLDADSVAANVNLADLYGRLGREAEGAELLRAAVAEDPGQAAYHHALGLSAVRSGDAEAGLAYLHEAAELAPDNARFAYVYAVALNSLGRPDEAIQYLRDILDDFPGDFDVPWTLATILRDQQRMEEAREVAIALQSVYPGIPPLENFLQSL